MLSYNQIVEEKLRRVVVETPPGKRKQAKKPAAPVTPLQQVQATAALAKETWTSVDITLLTVEHSFQAPLDTTKAYNMAIAYDKYLMGAITVAELEDGRYSVLDGQHRMAMAQLLLFKEVPIENLGKLTYEQRAYVFAERNLRRRTPAFGVLLHSYVERKEPRALALEKLLGDFGLHIDYFHTEGPDAIGAIRAPRTIWDLYTHTNQSWMVCLLNILAAAYGRDPEGYNNYILRGLHSFMFRYDKIDYQPRLIRVLKAATPHGLWQTAAEQAPSLQREKATAVAYAMYYLYNYHLTRGRLPAFSFGNIGNMRTAYRPTP